MARNGSGIYSLPSGNPVVAGTTIDVSWANPTLADLATAITGSIAADGQTPMSGPLRLADGLVTTPGLAFNTEASLGLYRPAAGTIGFTSGGSERIRINASGAIGIAGSNFGTAGQVLSSGGSAAAPTWTSTVTSAVAGTNISVSSATGAVTIAVTGTVASATNATNTAITDDTTTNATKYITWVDATSGNQPQKVSSTNLNWNPSTGFLGGMTTVSASSFLNLTRAAGTARTLRYQTSGSNRWDLTANVTAETGSNAGSNFVIDRYDDSGTRIDSPIVIVRSTGAVSFASTATFSNGLNSTSTIVVGTAGRVHLVPDATNSGYIEFRATSGTRQGYIGSSSTNLSQDTGTIPYVAGNHQFIGNTSFSGSVTATTFSGNATTATTLQTGRTIAMTGDVSWTSPSFNGSGNVTAAGTLATVNGSPQSDTFRRITVNGKGLVTATSAVAPGDITTALGYTPFNSSLLIQQSAFGGYTSATSTGLRVAGSTAFIEAVRPNSERAAEFVAASPNGLLGVFGSSQSTNNPQTGSMACIGVAGFTLNNNTTNIQSTYGGYFESRRTATAGTTQGVEIDIANFGNLVTTNPRVMGSSGITPCLWLASGGGYAGATTASVACGVVNNGAAFERGMVFGLASVTTGEAITMPRQYKISWREDVTDTEVVRIRCDATADSAGLVFDNSGLNIQNMSGTNIFQFNKNTGQLAVTGDTSVNGNIYAGVAATTGDSAIEVGFNRTGNGNAIIDLWAASTPGDYNGRIIRASGVNGNLSIINRGSGDVSVSSETGNITMSTSSSERMRMESAGRLLIGKTSAAANFKVDIDHDGAVNNGLFINDVGASGTPASLRVNTRTADTNIAVSVQAAGTDRFQILRNGNVLNTSNSYGAISDERKKQDITDAASQWDDIKAVRVRKFRMKDDPTGPLQIGVVAQELQQTSPGLIAQGVDGMLSVHYSVLYMKAVAALQEAMKRIEVLEAKLA